MMAFVEHAVDIVQLAAVLLLLTALTVSTGRFLLRIARGDLENAYRTYRIHLGRALLLTLEFLIAADILETVTVEKTVQSLVMLGGLVIVRTFLSFALELEIEGRWPWQARPDAKQDG
jgi:uncharacterized membrane protein